MTNATSAPPFAPPPFLTACDDTPQHVHYGFFGAQGGVSTGLYDSLNCGMGSDDDKSLVRQNRAIAANAIGSAITAMASLYQVHSADVVTIDKSTALTARPKADGLVTALPDIALSILTADCTPVLFYDAKARVIGACHAGWRGAASGIIQNMVGAMIALGARAEAISCLIGPTIAKASYQVGGDMRDEVLALAPHAAPYFDTDPDSPSHYYFDLPGFASACARLAQVGHISDIARDTYRESDVFFSHRRATHGAQSDTGRQIAIIRQSEK